MTTKYAAQRIDDGRYIMVGGGTWVDDLGPLCLFRTEYDAGRTARVWLNFRKDEDVKIRVLEIELSYSVMGSQLYTNEG